MFDFDRIREELGSLRKMDEAAVRPLAEALDPDFKNRDVLAVLVGVNKVPRAELVRCFCDSLKAIYDEAKSMRRLPEIFHHGFVEYPLFAETAAKAAQDERLNDIQSRVLTRLGKMLNVLDPDLTEDQRLTPGISPMLSLLRQSFSQAVILLFKDKQAGKAGPVACSLMEMLARFASDRSAQAVLSSQHDVPDVLAPYEVTAHLAALDVLTQAFTPVTDQGRELFSKIKTLLAVRSFTRDVARGGYCPQDD
jgi:hypothetical protein